MDNFCTNSTTFYACETNEMQCYSSPASSSYTKRSSESSSSNDFDIQQPDTFPLFDFLQGTNDFKLNINDDLHHQYIDPDEFLNDVTRNDDFASSYRSSPSPTNSNNSTGSEKYHQSPSDQNQFIFETPPVSPPTQINCTDKAKPIILKPAINRMAETCIPLTAVDLTSLQEATRFNQIIAPKKRLQPKPLNSSTTSKSLNKQTLVLSSQDFKALLKSMKNKTSTTSNVVLMKTAVKPELPTVLPKPMPQNNSLPFIVPPTGRQINDFSTVSSSNSDLAKLKKQQRLIKNRESADKSRRAKKEMVSQLENDVKVLKMENQTLKTENGQLKERLTQYESFACKCRESLMGGKSMKKNTAMVFAMLFMISMNFGPFGTLLSLDSKIKSDIPHPASVNHPSRNLLWAEDDYKNDTNTRSTFNRTYVDMNITTSCSLPLNQTENIRLENDLRKWIDELKYHNLSLNKVADLDFGTMDDTYFVSKHLLQSFYKEFHKMRKDMKRTTNRKSKSRKKKAAANEQYMQTTYKAKDHQLKVFSPSLNNYADFFDEIRRRDDTFYVVSLSGDHLLLPAMAHNVTLRPKMSLMLPSTGFSNGTLSSKFVTLMQIDCEVVNTSVIKIRERMIPEKLRSTWRHNTNEDTNPSPENVGSIKFPAKKYEHDKNISKQDSGTVKPKKPSVKPYFVDKFNENNQLYQEDNLMFSP